MTESAVSEQTEETVAPPIEELTVEAVIHRAVCPYPGCVVGVLYRPTPSGHGFAIVERWGALPDDLFTMGPSGLPRCPRDHGDLKLSDDLLPAEAAITEASGRLQQASLPGMIPPFNYQGAYLELEEKAVEVDRLHSDYTAAAEEARDAKKAWDKAAELYTKMALELRRRRREKVEAGSAISDVDPDRCAWEQVNPDAQCPVCRNGDANGIAQGNTAEHVEEVDRWLLDQSVEGIEDALHAVAMAVSEATIRHWTLEQRDDVERWAKATIEGEDPLHERPSVLGTMHVASELNADDEQCCTQCDTRLISTFGPYEAGMLVGTDCPGKPKEAQRYPKRRAKKKAKKSRA